MMDQMKVLTTGNFVWLRLTTLHMHSDFSINQCLNLHEVLKFMVLKCQKQVNISQLGL